MLLNKYSLMVDPSKSAQILIRNNNCLCLSIPYKIISATIFLLVSVIMTITKGMTI